MRVHIIIKSSEYKDQRESSNRYDRYAQSRKQTKSNISFSEILKKVRQDARH